MRVFIARLKTISKKAGLKRAINMQHLRYTFAREFLNRGGDLITLRYVMGYSTMQRSAVFELIETEHVGKEFRRTHPRAKAKIAT